MNPGEWRSVVVVDPCACSSGLSVHTPRSVHRAASGWRNGSQVQLGGCAWTGKEGGGQVGHMTVAVEGLTVKWASRSNEGGQRVQVWYWDELEIGFDFIFPLNFLLSWSMLSV